MNYKERYTPYLIGVNGAQRITGPNVGGFICKTSGNVSLTNANGDTLVDAIPVTAGQYLPLPILIDPNGSQPGGLFTCAGGASGTLLT